MSKNDNSKISSPEFTGTLDELLQDYRDLQLRVTRFSSTEQKLINTRNKLDNEINRHKRMHAFNKQALDSMSDDVFCKMVAEAVVDIMEAEVALVFMSHLDNPNFLCFGGEGIVLAETEYPKIKSALSHLCDSNTKSNQLQLDSKEFENIKTWLPLNYAYGIHIVDTKNEISLLLIGGVLEGKEMFYEKPEVESDMLFSIFSQQVLARAINRKKNQTIHNQVEKIETSSNRLSKITDNFLSFGSAPKSNIELLTKLSGDLLKADIAVYSKADECLIQTYKNKGQGGVSTEIKSCHFYFDIFSKLNTKEIQHFNSDEIRVLKNKSKCDFQGMKTYTGCAVMLDNQPIGWLALVYKRKYIPEENEKQIIKIISAGIAVEEMRNISIDKLRDNEQRLDSVVQTQHEMICRFLPDTTLKFANKPYCEAFGLSEKELMGKKVSDFVSADYHAEMKTALANLSKKNPNNTHIYSITDKNGNMIWQEWVESAIFNNKDEVIEIQAIGRDITESKRAEQDRLIAEENIRSKVEELTITNQKLEKLAKDNQELEQYAYLASHDLKEPLRTVENYIYLFEDDYAEKLDEQAHVYLETVKAAIKRMNKLIKTLLEFSQLGANRKLTLVNCNEMLKEILADLESSIKTSEATIEIAELPELNLYEQEARQLFQNLISNSIKFKRKDEALKIKISAEKITEGWKFAVSDNGIGIAQEHFKRVFEIFQRLHTVQEYEGTGIGLAHCKKIVKLHMGEIWINSTLGKGTIFNFTIQKI